MIQSLEMPGIFKEHDYWNFTAHGNLYRTLEHKIGFSVLVLITAFALILLSQKAFERYNFVKHFLPS